MGHGIYVMKQGTHEFAVKFLCHWLLSQKDSYVPAGIPNDKSLVYAMEKAVKTRKASKDISKFLHFSDASTGLSCIELEDILAEGERSGIISYNWPRARYEFDISKNAAQELLRRRGNTGDFEDFVSKVSEILPYTRKKLGGYPNKIL